MIILVLTHVVAVVGGGVFGVLFARRNVNKVEAAVAVANSVIVKLQSDIAALKAKVGV